MVQRVARLQLLVGLADAWIWPALVWAFGVGVLAQIHPALGLFGWAGCLLAPFGFLEVLLALHALRSNDARWSRRLAWLQLFSVTAGGLPSAAVGLYVLAALSGRPPR